MARLALVAAVARNGVIGSGGGMPWRLSTDMKRFKQLTIGKPVIMGRRTFASLKTPLAGRLNIVITRDANFHPEGAVTVGSLDAAIARAEAAAASDGVDELMVIGGGEIYRQAIARADRLYITYVEAAPDGDTHFPQIDPARWRVVSRQAFPAGEKDSAATELVIYDRTKSASGSPLRPLKASDCHPNCAGRG